MTKLSIAFSARQEPLDAIAVVGLGRVARTLAERLLSESDEHLHRWNGVAGEDVLVVLGDPQSLPWVDGVIYLGRDPDAPRLLIPTTLRPSVPMEIFERAVLGHASTRKGPLAVLRTPARIFSVADALPIERARLLAWTASAAWPAGETETVPKQ